MKKRITVVAISAIIATAVGALSVLSVPVQTVNAQFCEPELKDDKLECGGIETKDGGEKREFGPGFCEFKEGILDCPERVIRPPA